MMGRMKEILAYAVVIMIAIFLRDNFIGEMWAGSGSALFANAMLGMVVFGLVAAVFFDFLMGYTGMAAVQTAMTIAFVRIMAYDVYGFLNGDRDLMGSIVHAGFSLVVAYAAGTAYEKVAG